MTISDASWPPAYTTRKSSRAKHIRLSITPNKGLELILPNTANINDGLAFLESKRSWIQKHYITPEPIKSIIAPSTIRLPAINKQWHIRYEKDYVLNKSLSKKVKLIPMPDNLVFAGKDCDDFANCLPPLRDWLKLQAEIYLSPMIRKISEETGLKFNKLSWRFQNTLWGSCTNHKNISLNVKLLFLPPELAHHIMLHELCHTKYMSHGSRFWGLMKKFQNNYKQLSNQTKHIEKTMPPWVKHLWIRS